MNKINYLVALLLLLSAASCDSAEAGEKNQEQTTSEESANSSSTAKSNTAVNSKVTLTANGQTYTVKGIDQKKSYLQFYTSDSQIKQDGNFRISSESGENSLTVIVDGLDAKGKDQIAGTVQVNENNSVILFKEGETEIRFITGELTVTTMEKKSGKVKVHANGKCTIKVGRSYSDMKMDIPAQLSVESQITDVRTLNFKPTK